MAGLAGKRFWNIALRSVHLAAMAVLVGGLVFDVEFQPLQPWLYATLASGMLLAAVEAWPDWSRWLREGRGAMVLVKVALLATLPLFWHQRIAILLVTVVIASIGSHMPGRFRYKVLWGSKQN